MNRGRLEQELLAREERYWQAIQDRDAETAMRLSDENCILTGAQGVSCIDRQALGKMMESAPYTLREFHLSHPEVRLLGNDTAILAYQVHEELTLDGKPVTIDAADASTWVRRGTDWVCALHTESILGDPFGRDRAD